MGVSRIPAFQEITDEFTSSGTWVCPGGVVSAEFLVVGGGGGGGGADNSVNTRVSQGGGGGGGAVIKQILRTTPGSSYTITIGAAGTGGNATAGTNGGTSEIVLSGTTLIKAFGGAGGPGLDAADVFIYPTYGNFGGGSGTPQSSTDSSSMSGGGGAGVLLFNSWLGTPTDTPTGLQGSQGGTNSTGNTGLTVIGVSSDCLFGSGGNGAIADLGNAQATRQNRFIQNFGVGATAIATAAGAVNGNNATYYGCGGGGGVSMLSTDAATGGNGFAGLVRITYFA